MQEKALSKPGALMYIKPTIEEKIKHCGSSCSISSHTKDLNLLLPLLLNSVSLSLSRFSLQLTALFFLPGKIFIVYSVLSFIYFRYTAEPGREPEREQGLNHRPLPAGSTNLLHTVYLYSDAKELWGQSSAEQYI